MKMWMIPAMIAALGAPALAQEPTWSEVTFHRVHLNNGNFIDGALLGSAERSIVLQMMPGQMTIRRDSIERIEVVKMRSLVETAPKAPTLYKNRVDRTATAAPTLPAPVMDEVSKTLMETILARLTKMTIAQTVGVARDLMDIPKAGAFLAYKLPELSERACPTVGAVLMDLRDPESLEYVLHALDNSREYVILEALRVLGASADRSFGPKIRPFLEDNRFALRIAALTALQQIGDEEATESVLDQLTSENDQVRQAAIAATLDLTTRSGRKDLTERAFKSALQGARGRMAYDLLLAVGRTQQPALWKLVLNHLDDEDPMLRGAAVTTIATLAARDSVEPIARMLVGEGDKNVRFQLARAAKRLKSQDLLLPLIDWLRSTDPEIATAAETTLQAMTQKNLGKDAAAWMNWYQQVRSAK